MHLGDPINEEEDEDNEVMEISRDQR